MRKLQEKKQQQEIREKENRNNLSKIRKMKGFWA
jgi:hypothetical protein